MHVYDGMQTPPTKQNHFYLTILPQLTLSEKRGPLLSKKDPLYLIEWASDPYIQISKMNLGTTLNFDNMFTSLRCQHQRRTLSLVLTFPECSSRTLHGQTAHHVRSDDFAHGKVTLLNSPGRPNVTSEGQVTARADTPHSVRDTREQSPLCHVTIPPVPSTARGPRDDEGNSPTLVLLWCTLHGLANTQVCVSVCLSVCLSVSLSLSTSLPSPPPPLSLPWLFYW